MTSRWVVSTASRGKPPSRDSCGVCGCHAAWITTSVGWSAKKGAGDTLLAVRWRCVCMNALQSSGWYSSRRPELRLETNSTAHGKPLSFQAVLRGEAMVWRVNPTPWCVVRFATPWRVVGVRTQTRGTNRRCNSHVNAHTHGQHKGFCKATTRQAAHACSIKTYSGDGERRGNNLAPKSTGCGRGASVSRLLESLQGSKRFDGAH